MTGFGANWLKTVTLAPKNVALAPEGVALRRKSVALRSKASPCEAPATCEKATLLRELEEIMPKPKQIEAM